MTLIAKDERANARKLAREYSLRGSHRAMRDAGDAALEILDFIERPDSIGEAEEVKTFQKSRYYLAQLPANWKQAGSIAKAAGGHLASVTSAAEAEWLQRHYFATSDQVPAIWLGASNGAGGDRWSWITAEPWKDIPAEVPPAQEDSENPNYSESALVLAPGSEPLADGYAAAWKKRPCSEFHSFLIEWDEGEDTPVRSMQAIRPGERRQLVQVPSEE